MNLKEKKFWCLALDPIHIGTGEFQLGRVDNTIVREPATNLPKIPGSSLAGVARAYTAMNTPNKYLRPGAKPGTFTSCAGKGGSDGDEHCGQPDCPVCMAFGFSKKGTSFQGLVQFSDALLVLFPVAAVLGPLWVTSPDTLAAAGLGGDLTDLREAVAPNPKNYRCVTNTHTAGKHVKVGWLSLPAADCPVKLQDELAAFEKRLAVVSDDLFGQIVNDQLEIRTSVSIDPHTGTASTGALFTVEAMPRGTVLRSQYQVLDPNYFRVPPTNAESKFNQLELCEAVGNGLANIEHLGLGGMNTRGFGRMKIVERA